MNDPSTVSTNEKKEAILEAMLDLVVERGFHNAPMSLLSKRAGASAGVIYHYFPSKEDLIHALYLRVKSVKRQVLLEGYLAGRPAKEAFLQVWMNAYHFYRTHIRETRFLDQYENSPFCGSSPTDTTSNQDPASAHLLKLFRTKKAGGVLKDLPQEAIQEFTFGLAARLAKKAGPLKPSLLKKVAEASWTAIAAE
jgi:AcrR family transcriptional regulator